MIIYLTIGFIWMVAFDWLLQYGGNSGFTIKQSLFNIILWPLGMFFAIRGIIDTDDE
tara:strand:- start:258 stop:428 length:171 start_codon:yes stop_codon:yes gene_type:complete